MNEEKKRMAATALGLPKDVVLGDVLVRFTGFHEVCIENYRSILMYTDTFVAVSQHKGICTDLFKRRLAGTFFESLQCKRV